MKQNTLCLLLIATLFFLPACSKKVSQVEHPSPDITGSNQYETKQLAIATILVFPTEHSLTPNKFNTKEVTALNQGAQTLTDLLRAYFSNNLNVTMLTPVQAESFLESYIDSQQKEALYIGRKTKADAVLISQIYRFKELDGKKYGADEPASVSFDYQLIHVESGMTLCRGTYDETQEPLLSNLFNIRKASKRKFKFIKGAELLQEGIEAKFSQCSHLNP